MCTARQMTVVKYSIIPAVCSTVSYSRVSHSLSDTVQMSVVCEAFTSAQRVNIILCNRTTQSGLIEMFSNGAAIPCNPIGFPGCKAVPVSFNCLPCLQANTACFCVDIVNRHL